MCPFYLAAEVYMYLHKATSKAYCKNKPVLVRISSKEEALYPVFFSSSQNTNKPRKATPPSL